MHKQEKTKLLTDILGEAQQVGNELLFYCPKCNHHKKKLSINVEKGAWHCWVCEYRGSNLGRLVKRFGSFLQRQEWEALETSLDPECSFEDILNNLNGQKQEEKKISLELPGEFISLCNKGVPLSSREPLLYLKSRGVTKSDILKWKIGYASKGEYAGRVIVPSFDEGGELNYFVSRAYTKKQWPPYKSPAISKDIIYNELYVDFKNDLVLVEGVFDAFVCENSVPLLGSTLSENSKLFSKIVEMDTTIYIALDPDAERKAMRLIKSLLLYGVEVYKVDVSGYKDIGEMTKEEFKNRKKAAKQITNDSYLVDTFSAFL